MPAATGAKIANVFPRARILLVSITSFRYGIPMLHDEKDLDFVRHATAELAGSFTDARDHNLHAAFNGLIEAVQADRKRLRALEAEVQALRAQAAGQTAA